MGAINSRDDEPGEAPEPGGMHHQDSYPRRMDRGWFVCLFVFVEGGHITLWFKGLKLHLRALRGGLMPRLIGQRMDAVLTIWIKASRC